MRILLTAALALSLAGPALAAEPAAADTDPAVAAVTELARSAKNLRFRKLRLSPAGDVCGLVRTSAGARDMEFVWTKASGEVWIMEAPAEPNTGFVYGPPHLRRSTERADYRAWKACGQE